MGCSSGSRPSAWSSWRSGVYEGVGHVPVVLANIRHTSAATLACPALLAFSHGWKLLSFVPVLVAR
jgi:hypothetical protein